MELVRFYQRHETMLKSLFLLIFALYCAKGSFGVIIEPSNSIYVLEGEKPANDIFCSLDPSEIQRGNDLSELSLVEKCDYFEEERPMIVERLNATTVRYRFTKPAKFSKCNYTCRLKSRKTQQLLSYLYTNVFTGRKPDKVKRFDCISQNAQKMSCNFEEMDNNVPQYYILKFKRNHFKSPLTDTCFLQPNFDRTRSCTIYTPTNASEFYNVHTLYFFLNTSNRFLPGGSIEIFQIDHKSVIVPAPPEGLIVQNVTTNSADIEWSLNSILATVTGLNFAYEIEIMSQFDNYWVHYEGNQTYKQLLTSMEGLDYSYANYKIRVRIRSMSAPDTEQMWSEWTPKHSFRTLARAPDRPPRTIFGGFSVTDYDHIVIYWQPLHPSEWNGPNLRYLIRENGGDEQIVSNRNSTRFTNKASNKAYTFTITSLNDEGSSTSSSLISVPRRNDRLLIQIQLIKKFKDGIFSIDWSVNASPHLVKEISNFTIFWCKVKSDLPNDCVGSIEYEIVSANTRRFDKSSNTSSESLNFAIAANSWNSTTGMIWAECFSNPPDEIGKVSALFVPNSDIDATKMSVRWIIDCRDKQIVKAIQLKYCPILSFDDKDCLSPPQTLDRNASNELTLEALKPYTHYSINVSLISINGQIGKASPTYERTLESTPTPVRELKVEHVTNTSIALSWLPPMEMNGELRNYRVFANGMEKDAGKTTSFTITDLKGFTDYEIVVKACTIDCSENSNTVFVKTKIGAPSQVKDLFNNKTDLITLSWSSPDSWAGPLDFYEIKIVAVFGNERRAQLIYIDGRHTSCKLFYDICTESHDYYLIDVRAYNFIPLQLRPELDPELVNSTIACENDERIIALLENRRVLALPGEASNMITVNCNTVSYIWLFILIPSMAIMVWSSFWLARKIRRISDITIKYPDGMAELLQHSSEYRTLSLPDYEKIVPQADPQVMEPQGLPTIVEERELERLVTPKPTTNAYVQPGPLPALNPSLALSPTAAPIVRPIIVREKPPPGHHYTPMKLQPNVNYVQLSNRKDEEEDADVVLRNPFPRTTVDGYLPMSKPVPESKEYCSVARGISSEGYVKPIVAVTPNRISDKSDIFQMKHLSQPKFSTDSSGFTPSPVQQEIRTNGDYVTHQQLSNFKS